MGKLYLAARETGSMVLIFVFGLAIIGYGVFAVLKPETAWKLEHLGRRWMYRDTEPTEGALVLLRVVGAAAIIGGIFFILFMLWLTVGREGAI